MLIVLDSGPLGLLSNPTPNGVPRDAQQWARRHIAAGARFVVPEIADYEIRRELIRARKSLGIIRLNELCNGLGYEPLSTPVLRAAAELWALARNEGYPTAHDAALDGDVVLAAQARSLRSAASDNNVVVATTNVAHLQRFVDAKHWTDI